MTEIREHMEVIGADGVHIGTVDKLEGNRIKLTRKDSGEGSHKGHHHFIDRSLVAEVEGDKVRLSANGAVAVTMEEESGQARSRLRPPRSGKLMFSKRPPESGRFHLPSLDCLSGRSRYPNW